MTTANSEVKKTLGWVKDHLSEAVIVESGKTASGWWRKWSDGFIEQSGYASSNSGDNITISFPKSFSNTKYLFLSTPGADEDHKACIAVHISKTGRSKASCRVFITWAGGNGSGPLGAPFSYSWYASGY